MRRFSININVENTDECAVNFKKLLSVLAFDDKTEYEVVVDVSKIESINPNDILSIVKCQQEFSKKHKAIFKNSLLCNYMQLRRSVRNCAIKYGFDIVINYDGIFENNRRLEKIVNRLKKSGAQCLLHMNSSAVVSHSNFALLSKTKYRFEFEEVMVSNVDLISEFDLWCLTGNECYSYKTFEDILYRILLGQSHSDCTHSSCLGKRISMKSNGDLYFCHRNAVDSYLKNVADVRKYVDLFEADSFSSVLTKSIERRHKCSECESFAYCQSGCSLCGVSQEDMCSEQEYCKLLRHIGEYLYQKLMVEKELPINPIIRRIVLVSIAYKGKIEINKNSREVIV